MRKCKYRGGEGLLGRFGHVHPGAVLELTEEEAVSVGGSPAFAMLRDSPPDGFPEKRLPPRGAYFDLTTMHWESNRIFRDVGRLKRSRLTAAIKQFEAAGFPVPKLGQGLDVKAMREFVLETGRHAGWR